MNTLPARQNLGSPNLWTHSTLEGERRNLASVIAALEMEANIGLNARTKLLPRSDCEVVVKEIDARGYRFATELEAIDAAKTLIGMYPARQVHDAATYSHAMKTVFMAAELDFVRRVVDPVNGLPSRLRHLPTVAEVNEALIAEKKRRIMIRGTAAWMIKQHEIRDAQSKEETMSEEEMARRKAQVAALLGGRGPGTGDWTGEGEP